MAASKIQQRLGSLYVPDMIEANCMVRELLRLKPAILFRKPTEIKVSIIVTFSDASHSGVRQVYGQSCIVSGIMIDIPHRTIYHPVIRSTSKQKKISYSSYGAEILAAANADDRDYSLKQALHALFPETELKHELLVDSKSLLETITTLYQPGDSVLRKVVARMQDSFEA